MSQAVLDLPARVRESSLRTEHRVGTRGRPVVERDVAGRSNRAARRVWLSCVRWSIEADTYENDLKLSIALDRLLDEIERP